MDIAIYTLTSSLHDAAAVSALSEGFLKEVFPRGGFLFRGDDFSDFAAHGLSLIYVRTGGAEGLFRQALPKLLEQGVRRFYLLTSGKSNSLAASLEILSYLRQHRLQGEVLHGTAAYLQERIRTLSHVETTLRSLRGKRIGRVGAPSDWLIASAADEIALRERLGLEIIDVPMEVLLAEIRRTPKPELAPDAPEKRPIAPSFPGAVQIYLALKEVARQFSLDALTLRCFDLLTAVGNTGCLALARLNAEGTTSSCEGDVPALVSMMVLKALTGCPGFQANPARIDVTTGEILFAHCTIPLDLAGDFCYDTHFESGIGVGIHGHFPEGPVTVFKVSGDASRHFAAEGVALENPHGDNLCRTQVKIQLKPEDARYFLSDPIGNHHILIPGHWKDSLDAAMASAQRIPSRADETMPPA